MPAVPSRSELSLDPIEKAIRNALAKGDATDEAFRERVYQSVFSAFERALAGREPLSPEEVETRRARLRARIVQIESEFVPAMPEMSPEPDFGPSPAFETEMPSLDPRDRMDPYPDIEDEEEVRGPQERRGSKRKAERRRMPRLLAFLLVALVGLALLLVFAWWILFGSLSAGGTVQAPGSAPPTDEIAAHAPVDDREWIRLFDPQDPTNLSLASGAEAGIAGEGANAFLRLRGSSQSSLNIEIGRGILERLAGRTALFSITASTPEEHSQIAVECSLGELGDCGRRRFEILNSETEFLFEVKIPDRSPGSAGMLIIHPGMEGAVSEIDIRQVRVFSAP